MLFPAHKTVAFGNASGIAFPDGGLREEHIRAAYLAFCGDEFGHYNSPINWIPNNLFQSANIVNSGL